MGTILLNFGNENYKTKSPTSSTIKFSKDLNISANDSFPNILSIHCGGQHSCILLGIQIKIFFIFYWFFFFSENGDVYSAGTNHYGELGLGNTTTVNNFTKIDLKDVRAVTLGYHFSKFFTSKKMISFFVIYHIQLNNFKRMVI